MSAVATPPEANGKELKGWHVLIWMLGFFGLIFAVNGVFLYHAITSFPGEDVKKSYLQGLNYNQTLEARAAQAELGWRAEIGLVDSELVLRLEDRDGDPVSGRAVIGELRRTTMTGADQVLVFNPGVSGAYTARVDGLGSGQWETRIDVLDYAAERTEFTARKTLYLP